MSQEYRTLEVNLDLRPTDLTDIDDVFNVMNYYQQMFGAMLSNVQSNLKTINNLKTFLITVMVGEKSIAYRVDQIDLEKSFNKLIESAASLDVTIPKEAYREAYEFFCKEAVDSETGIYESTRFIGLNIYVTRLASTKEQKETAKKRLMENFIAANFREKDGVRYLDMNVHGLPVKHDESKPS